MVLLWYGCIGVYVMKQNTDDTMMCRNCGDTATVREVFDSSGGDCEAHTFGKHDWSER